MGGVFGRRNTQSCALAAVSVGSRPVPVHIQVEPSKTVDSNAQKEYSCSLGIARHKRYQGGDSGCDDECGANTVQRAKHTSEGRSSKRLGDMHRSMGS